LSELYDLELESRKSQRKKVKILTRKAPSLKRRKPHKMGGQGSKQAEIGVIERVSNNGIMNRNEKKIAWLF